MSHEPIHIEDNDETTQNQEYTKKRRRPNKEKPPQELRKRGRPLDPDYYAFRVIFLFKKLIEFVLETIILEIE